MMQSRVLWPRRIEGHGGFVLAEVLFAIMALVIAAVWLLAAYRASLELTEVAQQTSVAVNDLKNMLEKIKATPFSQINTVFPDGAVNGIVNNGPDQYGPMVGGYSLNNEQITVSHQPSVGADPQELVVKIIWTNYGRTYQRSLSTLRSSKVS